MDIPIGIDFSANDLEERILRAFVRAIDRKLAKSLSSIKTQIKALISAHIENSPVYASLTSGGDFGLNVQLGIKNPLPVLEKIIQVVQSSMRIELKPIRVSGKNISGGVSFFILRSDYNDILSIAGIEYESVNRRRGTKYRIPWGEWLLLSGDDLLVIDHHIIFGDFDQSRTGGAIMAPKGYFRMPSVFSGTAGNNFLTRALDKNMLAKEIANILRLALN